MKLKGPGMKIPAFFYFRREGVLCTWHDSADSGGDNCWRADGASGIEEKATGGHRLALREAADIKGCKVLE